MSASLRRIATVLIPVCLLAVILSCARSQQLVSIQIQPSAGAVFGAADPALFVNFKAFGTYIHPPQQLDITNTVQWQSDTPEVAQVSSTGVVTPNTGCGKANVFATMHNEGNDIVSNSASIQVDGPAAVGCTPAGPQPVLTVAFAGNGTGTVTSSPSGITCTSGSTCSNTFTVGTTITLTASPAGGSSFGGWSGCNESSGVSCTVFLENSVTVTATFN